MPAFVLEIILILVLIAANGVFAMSEIAIVSVRRPRLEERARRGDKRARIALEMSENPGHFLSTVQVGITLVGIFTGAFGGATLANGLADVLRGVPALAAYAHPIALFTVVVLITYLSLILGELVPKQLGLTNAERVAMRVARPMRLLSRVGSPMVRFLSASTNLVIRLLRVRPPEDPAVTEEEVKIMLRQGASAGTFEETERIMVESVFRLADWRVGAVMTPRTDIEWLDPSDPVEEIIRTIESGSHSHFPVAEDSLDSIIGVIHAKSLLVQCLSGKALDLRAMAKPPLYVPESMRVLKLLEQFRHGGSRIALVVDEYGSFEGIVTLSDVLEAVVRDLPTYAAPGEELMAVRREDGSWLLDGGLPIDQFKEIFNIDELPEEDAGYYQTLGGLVMMQLGHIPAAGEHFNFQGVRVEVMDMDGNRVDKVLALSVPPDEEEPGDDDRGFVEA